MAIKTFQARWLVLPLFGVLIGCGGFDEPTAATYRGDVPHSFEVSLQGDLVFTIAKDGDVLGTLETDSGVDYELRGEMNGINFTCDLDSTATDYSLSGTIVKHSESRINVDWVVENGDADPHLIFEMRKL